MNVDKSSLFSDRSLSFSFIPPSDFLALRLAERAPTTQFAPKAQPDFGLSEAESIFLSNILKLARTYFEKNS